MNDATGWPVSVFTGSLWHDSHRDIGASFRTNCTVEACGVWQCRQPPFSVTASVLVLGRLGHLLDVLVARVAQLRGIRLQHLRVGGAVRIVTPDAIVFRRLVHKLELREFLLGHDVAGEAQIRRLIEEQFLAIGAVGRMANRALADRHRTVQELDALGGRMALRTKVRHGLLGNQGFAVAAVRIVALGALARLQRLVDILLGGLIQMAVLAEVAALPGQLVRVGRRRPPPHDSSCSRPG